MTTVQLAKLLKPFRIRPKPLWIDNATKQGYERSMFEDAWERYLDSPPSTGTQDTQEPSRSGALEGKGERKDHSGSWGYENSRNPDEQGVLGDLGDDEPVEGLVDQLLE